MASTALGPGTPAFSARQPRSGDSILRGSARVTLAWDHLAVATFIPPLTDVVTNCESLAGIRASFLARGGASCLKSGHTARFKNPSRKGRACLSKLSLCSGRTWLADGSKYFSFPSTSSGSSPSLPSAPRCSPPAGRRLQARTLDPARRLAAEALDLERRISDLVNAAYGLTPEEIALMWRTAPPRMPLSPP